MIFAIFAQENFFIGENLLSGVTFYAEHDATLRFRRNFFESGASVGVVVDVDAKLIFLPYVLEGIFTRCVQPFCPNFKSKRNRAETSGSAPIHRVRSFPHP